jgi:hypothetical protein
MRNGTNIPFVRRSETRHLSRSLRIAPSISGGRVDTGSNSQGYEQGCCRNRPRLARHSAMCSCCAAAPLNTSISHVDRCTFRTKDLRCCMYSPSSTLRSTSP